MRSASLLAFALFTLLCVSSLISAFSLFGENKRQQPFSIAGLPPAPATLKIDDTLFNKIAAVVVPTINTLAKNIVIPAISSDHFDVDPIHIDDFDLGPIQFSFIAPNEVKVSLSQISFSIPQTHFELKDKILFVHIHCSGHAYGSVNVAADFSFKLDDTDGHIALDGATAVNVDYKTLNIGYKMDHTACKIVSKLINFVIGGITDKIKDAIEKDLGPGIQKALQKGLSDALAKLPVTVTGSPSVAGGVLSIPINLDSFVKSTGNNNKKSLKMIRAPPLLASSSSKNDRFSLTRDLAVELPASSANTILGAVFAYGKLKFNHTEHHLNTSVFRAFIPEAYDVCPNCPINIAVDVLNTPPMVDFSTNNFTLNVANLSLGFSAYNTSTGSLSPLFTVASNVGFSVDNFAISTNSTDEVIKFALGVSKINLQVISSNVGKISDVSTINSIINVIVSFVVPSFNKVFPGIALPTGGAFALSDIFIQVGSGLFQAGSNVELHI